MPSKNNINGAYAELKVGAEAIRRNYTVCYPHGDNAQYDIVLDTGTSMDRVQIKYASMRENGCLVVYPQSSTGKTYADNSVDYYLIYCPDTDKIYKVPVLNKTMSLRIKDTKNKQTKLVNLAKDFEWI